MDQSEISDTPGRYISLPRVYWVQTGIRVRTIPADPPVTLGFRPMPGQMFVI